MQVDTHTHRLTHELERRPVSNSLRSELKFGFKYVTSQVFECASQVHKLARAHSTPWSSVRKTRGSSPPYRGPSSTGDRASRARRRRGRRPLLRVVSRPIRFVYPYLSSNPIRSPRAGSRIVQSNPFIRISRPIRFVLIRPT